MSAVPGGRYSASPPCVLKKLSKVWSLLHDQMNVGGLGLNAVARISNDAHGSMVSGHFISTLGGTRIKGNAQSALDVLEAEMPLRDVRPALAEM